MGEERSDTELVLAARDEDPAAFGQLFERWFDRSWNVARTILRDDDLAADVAQDTMVKAWQQLDQLRDADAFGGWLLRSTRNRALNRLAREGRSRASGDDVVSGLRDRGGEDPVGAERQPEPDLVNEIRDRQELVWAAATALGERDVSLLDLHLRHGLSPAEIAEELGVEANAAHQQLFRLRGRLGDAIGSYLLWRNGRPLCDGLAEAVSGRTAFDRSVAKAVARHQANCEHCSGERESMVDPSKLFAAVPLLLVPPHLKAEAAAALQSVGVPTDSSAANADAGAGDAGSGDAGSGNSGSADSGSGQTGTSPGGDGTAGSGTGGGTSSPGEGIRLDLAGSSPPPPAPAAAAPGTTLAQEVIGSGPGPSSLAPSLAMPKGRVLALAGVGAVAVAALVAIGAFIMRDGDPGEGVAAIASDTPEPLAAAQDGGADDDSSGAASFSPSSTAASTTQSATGSTDAGGSTTVTTASSTSPSTTPTTPTTATSLSTTETTGTSTTPTTGTTRTTPTTGTTRTTPTTGTTTTTTDPIVTSTSRVTVTVTVTVSVTPPPTPPPADPPIVVRFTSRISRTTLQCLRGQRTYDALWFAEFTDSVSLSLPGRTARGGSEGSVQFCGEAGQTISITASGPGGTDSASTTL